MIYDLKTAYSNPEEPKRMNIQLILFLTRMFNETKIKYWPIEFEMAGWIWVILKIRHMTEAAKQTTVIFTDYAANISIAKQTILANNNIDKLIFGWYEHFFSSQFWLNVKYRPGKTNIIPDAFSRLTSGNGPVTLSCNSDSLNLNLYIFVMLNPSTNADCYTFQKNWFSYPTIFENKSQTVMFKKIYGIN